MNYFKLTSFIFGILFAVGAYAAKPAYIDDLGKVNRSQKGSMWIKFKPERGIKVQDIFQTYSKSLGLGDQDNMILMESNTTKSGWRHSRFQQTYKGVPVDDIQFILHEKNGKLEQANGAIVKGLDLDVRPTISVKKALKIALNAISAEKYMWQDRNEERFLKNSQKDDNATYYPKGELILTRKEGHTRNNADNFVLAYRFNVHTKTPRDVFAIYIDAHSGVIIKKRPLARKCAAGHSVGSANTLFNGNQTIYTEWTANSGAPYRLLDTCRAEGIHTYQRDGNDIHDVYDDYNNWNESSHRPVASAHWATEMTVDYLGDYLRGASYELSSVLDKGNDHCDNAAWYPGTQWVYMGKPCNYANDYLVTLDIVGHEWGHFWLNYPNTRLNYEYESGALDESFADIFGEMVEFSVENSSGDWINGADVFSSNCEYPDGKSCVRDMANPRNGGYPDTYFDDNWVVKYRLDGDGGIHTNSSVQNRWFYLLSVGGSGTNSLGTPYSVNGIGRDAAFEIVKRTIQYLTHTSEYWDVYYASTLAAEDLFGDDPDELSNEEIQVRNAWAAVGVPSVDLVLDHGDYFQERTYRATNSITAGPFDRNYSSTFIAGDHIRLVPGFHFKADGYGEDFVFRAVIDSDLDEILAE